MDIPDKLGKDQDGNAIDSDSSIANRPAGEPKRPHIHPKCTFNTAWQNLFRVSPTEGKNYKVRVKEIVPHSYQADVEVFFPTQVEAATGTAKTAKEAERKAFEQLLEMRGVAISVHFTPWGPGGVR